MFVHIHALRSHERAREHSVSLTLIVPPLYLLAFKKYSGCQRYCGYLSCRVLQGLVFHLLPGQQWDSLPDATARSCVPYWLEAAGWAVALLSDATAAAMGPLDATPRPDRPRRLLDDKASTGTCCCCSLQVN